MKNETVVSVILCVIVVVAVLYATDKMENVKRVILTDNNAIKSDIQELKNCLFAGAQKKNPIEEVDKKKERVGFRTAAVKAEEEVYA